MEIGSNAGFAAALGQAKSRQDVTVSAMKRDAQQQASLAGEIEKAAKTGASQNGTTGAGATTETRGQKLNISV